jgi:trimeric autotransporter adhesin
MRIRFVVIVALLSGVIGILREVQAPASGLVSAVTAGKDRSDRGLAPTGLASLDKSAQSAISETLGRDSRRYRAQARGAGFRVENPRHHLVADFDAEGVAIHSGLTTWKLALRAFGFGNDLKPIDGAAPEMHLNRMEYRHKALTEWYVNGPLGLEQGFTVYEPGARGNSKPLTIALEMSGDTAATVDRSGTGLTLSGYGRQPELRYSGLIASDAGGMPLRTWIELQGEQLLVRVSDTGARYPIVIDPFIQLAKLTASDGQYYDEFGYSVAASGNTVVVGAQDNAPGNVDDAGAVYVFVKPSKGWENMTQVAKLVASDGKVDDDLGTSVAISGDTVVSGAPHSVEGEAPGAVYVFVKPPNGWADMTETAKLTPSDSVAADFFGYRLSMSANTVVVGAPTKTSSVSPGAAYVFVKPASGWKDMTETAKLTTSGSNATGLGSGGVSISGNVVVAGETRGTSFVYVEPAAGWKNMVQTAKLMPAAGHVYPVGSVAISGNTVVAGLPSAKVGGHQFQGEAVVFVKPASGWIDTAPTAVLTASDGAAGDRLGFSTSVAGNTVVLGAPDATVGGNAGQGAAYVFVNASETAKLTEASGAPYDVFGYSVAINGSIVVVGAVEVGPKGETRNGAAYIF